MTADKIIPTPNENNTNNISGIGDNITVQCNSERIAIITRSNAVNEAIRLIKLENTLEITNKYFGTYTFLINAAFPVIADIALDVDSL